MLLKFYFTGLYFISTFCLYCAQPAKNKETKEITHNMDNKTIPVGLKTDTAYFGEGCFWCTEAFFQRLNGVYEGNSGYGGGHVPNPTYEQVCYRNTGHVELAQIIYAPKVVSFDELLEVFWKTHDPTTLNQQGADVGPQYKSVILYTNEEQRQKAEAYKLALDKSGAFNKPIVTAIGPFKNFYPAENYHQNYYNNNGDAPYCRFVIRPKLEKFEKVFKNKLKPGVE
jgi:peptide-methionine (S)-S-oxide reductase